MATFSLAPEGVPNEMTQDPMESRKADTERIKRMSKDELILYCKDHFLNAFTIDPTESVATCRKKVTAYLEQRLDSQRIIADRRDPVPSEGVKKIVEMEPEIDDQAQDINPDGSPRFVIAKANNMVWPTNQSTLDHLLRHRQNKMREYTPCDRFGHQLTTDKLLPRYRGTN